MVKIVYDKICNACDQKYLKALLKNVPKHYLYFANQKNLDKRGWESYFRNRTSTQLSIIIHRDVATEHDYKSKSSFGR